MVLVGTSFWVALMRLLLPLLARSQIGRSLLIFQSLLALVLVVGLLMLRALRSASRSGLPARLTLLIGFF